MFQFLSGFAVGFGTGVLTREIVPVLRGNVLKGNGKSAAKNILKLGVRSFERSREAVYSLGESVEDLFAEARYEVDLEERESPPAMRESSPQRKKTGQRATASKKTTKKTTKKEMISEMKKDLNSRKKMARVRAAGVTARPLTTQRSAKGAKHATRSRA
jgi:hypothetical protein